MATLRRHWTVDDLDDLPEEIEVRRAQEAFVMDLNDYFAKVLET